MAEVGRHLWRFSDPAPSSSRAYKSCLLRTPSRQVLSLTKNGEILLPPLGNCSSALSPVWWKWGGPSHIPGCSHCFRACHFPPERTCPCPVCILSWCSANDETPFKFYGDAMYYYFYLVWVEESENFILDCCRYAYRVCVLLCHVYNLQFFVAVG